jgi:GNAT superfamily N-acetyltransferase
MMRSRPADGPRAIHSCQRRTWVPAPTTVDLPTIVRPFTAADVEPARWVIYRAYAQVLLDLYGPEAAGRYEVRSPGFMSLYLERDPAGAFVAEAPGGALAGAVFCFAWGEVGWFGSLGVAPEWQGKGVAQQLTARAVEYLAGRGCRRIGLETWPHVPLVEHLYGKFGFRAYRTTVKLSRPVARAAAAPRPGWQTQWAAQSNVPALAEALPAVEHVAGALARATVDPAPDYGAEVRAPVAAGWAEALVVRNEDGEPAAMALCFVRKPSGGPVSALDARLLLVAPGPCDDEALDATLAALDSRAAGLGLDTVTCDVNLRYTRATRLLRTRGFRPIYELIRMERPTPGFDPMSRSPVIECARWAG